MTKAPDCFPRKIRRNIWKNYVTQLFEDDRSEYYISAAVSGPSVTKEKDNQANKLAKNGKFKIFNKAVMDAAEGIMVNGIIINNIKYANDTSV